MLGLYTSFMLGLLAIILWINASTNAHVFSAGACNKQSTQRGIPPCAHSAGALLSYRITGVSIRFSTVQL